VVSAQFVLAFSVGSVDLSRGTRQQDASGFVNYRADCCGQDHDTGTARGPRMAPASPSTLPPILPAPFDGINAFAAATGSIVS
jgi:hypothetical protein